MLLEGSNTTEPLLEARGRMPRDILLFAFGRGATACQTHVCSAHPAPQMPRSPVREVVPVEIVVQVAVTAAGEGERRTSHPLCGAVDAMEQPRLGTARHPPGVHPHPQGAGGIPESTVQAAWAAAQPGKVAVPWQGFALAPSKGVEGDGESLQGSISRLCSQEAAFRAP